MQIKAKEPAPLAPPTPESTETYTETVEEFVEDAVSLTASKERKTSNVVLVVLGLFMLAFIVTMIVIFCVKGSVPDTLIQCTMGAGGLEALVLAGIKVSKVLAGDKPSSDPPNGVG